MSGYTVGMAETVETKILNLELPCAPDAPRTVRAALRRSESAGGANDDVMLVASELVTKAVLHAGREPGRLLNVRVSERDRRVVISVHDPGVADRQGAPWAPAEPGVGEWGLLARLSERWGVERPDSYRVWAEVAVSR